jgi:hydroxypyruvate isomerase
MLKFSANISTLFNEVPLIERFALAADAGFNSIEIQFPYSLKKQQIKEQLEKHHLRLNLINLPAGDLALGDLGIACLPDRKDEFKESVELAIEYATFLDVPKINCLAGKKPIDLAEQIAHNTMLENTDYAASQLALVSKILLIEAINSYDVKDFFLNHSAIAKKLINQVNRENLKFQYDIYHMQIMEGNLINTITDLFNIIGHIQIADVPFRGEPGSGEINFLNIFNTLAILGYNEHIGLEYFPVKSTSDGLATLAPLLNLTGG